MSQHFINEKLINDLRDGSTKRQDNLSEFSYQRERIDWLEKRNDQEDFSLNVADRIATRRDERAYTNKLKDRMEALAENDEYVAEKVLLDIALEKEKESRLAHIGEETEEEGEAEEEGRSCNDLGGAGGGGCSSRQGRG